MCSPKREGRKNKKISSLLSISHSLILCHQWRWNSKLQPKMTRQLSFPKSQRFRQPTSEWQCSIRLLSWRQFQYLSQLLFIWWHLHLSRINRAVMKREEITNERSMVETLRAPLSPVQVMKMRTEKMVTAKNKSVGRRMMYKVETTDATTATRLTYLTLLFTHIWRTNMLRDPTASHSLILIQDVVEADLRKMQMVSAFHMSSPPVRISLRQVAIVLVVQWSPLLASRKSILRSILSVPNVNYHQLTSQRMVN